MGPSFWSSEDLKRLERGFFAASLEVMHIVESLAFIRERYVSAVGPEYQDGPSRLECAAVEIERYFSARLFSLPCGAISFGSEITHFEFLDFTLEGLLDLRWKGAQEKNGEGQERSQKRGVWDDVLSRVKGAFQRFRGGSLERRLKLNEERMKRYFALRSSGYYAPFFEDLESFDWSSVGAEYRKAGPLCKNVIDGDPAVCKVLSQDVPDEVRLKVRDVRYDVETRSVKYVKVY